MANAPCPDDRESAVRQQGVRPHADGQRNDRIELAPNQQLGNLETRQLLGGDVVVEVQGDVLAQLRSDPAAPAELLTRCSSSIHSGVTSA
jgi:hypothetical protein